MPVAAADDHLKRMIGKEPLIGLAELVWNSFDAEAKSINIEVKETAAGGVDSVVVSDDGHGFTVDEITEFFSQVGGSWKSRSPTRKTRSGDRMLHGAKGEGRLRAFAIGDEITWESVTLDADGKPIRVRVSLSTAKLDEVDYAEPVSAPGQTPGTRVVVSAGMKRPDQLLADDMLDRLCAIFALWLTSYPVTLTYRGDRVLPERLIARKHEQEVTHPGDPRPAKLTVLEWDVPMERGLFLCDEHGAVLHRTDAGIQAPGFDFTAYLAWPGFREHEELLPLVEIDGNDVILPVVLSARQALRDYFRDRRAEESVSIVQRWKDEEVYPYTEEPTTPVRRASQALFNYVATTAVTAVDSIKEKPAKAVSLGAIRVALESDPESLEPVLLQWVSLSPDKQEEMRNLLQKTTLTAILSVLRDITGRLEFLAGLEALLFGHGSAHVLERTHLHPMIEREPWLFGEEFALHVSDRSLTTLLEQHIGIMDRTALVDSPVLDEEGRTRRVDFLFGRKLELNQNRSEHLVVEIKRPNVVIGRKELDQIEDYANAVASDSRFDKHSTDWDFVLLGTNFDPVAVRRLNQEGLPRGLIANPKDTSIKVWARPWSEVIQECNHRLKYVRRHLEYDPGGDEAIEIVRQRYPDCVPELPPEREQ